MKRKFFLRRATSYFGLMMIPTMVLFAVFLVFTAQSTSASLADKGRQTIEAAVENCEQMIERTSQQNDMLTTTARMNVSLKRALNDAEMTYGDSVFITALSSLVRSTIDSTPPLDSVLIWLDDAPRMFSSAGSGGIKNVEQQDLTWLEAYQSMPDSQRDRLCLTVSETGDLRVTSIRRLLLLKGCTVVHVNAEEWGAKLRTLLQRSDEHLLVLSNEGELLLHVSNGAGSHIQVDDALARELLTMPQDQWLDTDAGQMMISHVATEQVHVIALVPIRVLYANLRVTLQTFLVILLVNICIVMLLAYITTRRISRQMMLMIDMLDNAVRGLPVERPEKHTNDEYDMIMNNILYMYLRDHTLRSELQEKQYQKEHAELMALQLQINPHFLYNTLQTLDVTIRGEKADKYDLCDIIRAVSDILKYALSNPQESVTLRDEIHYLKEYAAVQKFRFGSRFVLYFEVEDELLDCRVFRLMLQPLVENSMLHGLNGLSERGYIWVRARREGERLHVSVRDSGAGMQEEELNALRLRIRDANSRSIGLTNLNRRLLLRYGEESELQITARQGEGMEVSFTIPLEMVSSDDENDNK